MTKELLIKILDYGKQHNIPEKKAALKFLGKEQYLTYYKKKYNIDLYKQGKHPNSKTVKRQFNVNDKYFSNINVYNSYYAGFIAADGNISSNKLIVGLSDKDTLFLQQMKRSIGSNYKLYNQLFNGFKSTKLVVTSNQIVSDLRKNFNIIEKKSLILTPPLLDTIYKDCFIIGLIDGDGSIGRYKINRCNTEPTLSISCVGTKEILLFIKHRFEEILGKKSTNLFCRDIYKNFYSYRISALNARIIFKFYYENYVEKYNLPVLSRKWKKEYYDYCLNFKKKKHICRRKGVNIFDLKGNFIKHFDTLKDAAKYTGASFGRISTLCKLNSNLYEAKGYMFSRDETMKPYIVNKCINKKHLKQIVDKGLTNIEDSQSQMNEDEGDYGTE